MIINKIIYIYYNLLINLEYKVNHFVLIKLFTNNCKIKVSRLVYFIFEFSILF